MPELFFGKRKVSFVEYLFLSARFLTVNYSRWFAA